MHQTRVQHRRHIAVVLAGVAGFVDAAGFLSLDLFSAHVSGNTARLGAYLGSGLFVRAGPSGFAVAVFVLAIAVGTIAMEFGWRSHSRRPAAAVLGAEVVMLSLLAGVGTKVGLAASQSGSRPAVYYPLAALAVGAMGLQTAALQRVSGRTVRTTFVSGMLTSLTDEVVAWMFRRAGPGPRPDESFVVGQLGLGQESAPGGRISLLAGIWIFYVAGATLGGYLQTQWKLVSLAIPAGILLLIATYEIMSPSVTPVAS